VAKQFALETLLEERQEKRTGTGVFLGTVHSVKGMEFPHVFLLDDGWHQGNLEEERRLFYVGMTRAEKSLYLFSVDPCTSPHIPLGQESRFLYAQNAPKEEIKGFSREVTVTILGMADLFLDYPGRFPRSHPIHQDLAALKTGEKVTLEKGKQRLFVVNRGGKTIAALSRKASEKWHNRLDTIISAKVLGIVKREKNETSDPNATAPKVILWELPVVEILHHVVCPRKASER